MQDIIGNILRKHWVNDPMISRTVKLQRDTLAERLAKAVHPYFKFVFGRPIQDGASTWDSNELFTLAEKLLKTVDTVSKAGEI